MSSKDTVNKILNTSEIMELSKELLAEVSGGSIELNEYREFENEYLGDTGCGNNGNCKC